MYQFPSTALLFLSTALISDSYGELRVRQTLLDEIRRVRAAKRQAPPTALWPDASEAIDIEVLSEVLQNLEKVSPDHARLVDLRFFSGLPLEEIAALEGVSLSTMKRKWAAARAWLLDALG